ncbi:hypothetical protein OTB20_25230 [Streptomyces sp. H27-H1]|uniref:hypothetical protein n=1 Tax=unclassified Streptomyces TaxID=2593676 RepID=UPI00226E5FB8|nr:MULTISPECIES: hypothetical protein [unclassified Streptomyces]MCY0929442.1 hypothetical protein [Streptomyces sp. H27-H1]MCY0938342.1 hypothetical protein [Streptomyces sp. H34-S4]
MPTTVMGFRLGCDERGRQVTVVLTEAGVLHRCNGPMGLAAKPAKPGVPPSVDPHPVPRQAAKLRKIHADLTSKGYTRALIPPACVRLEISEHPLHEHPYGPDAPPPHPELVEEFVGLAPSGPRSLDEAVRAFYTAIGISSRPKHPIPPRQVPTPLPPRASSALRVLTSGSAITSPARRTVGWRITADGVRLHVGPSGEDLTPREIADLQAALAAWLRLNPTHSEQRTGAAPGAEARGSSRL